MLSEFRVLGTCTQRLDTVGDQIIERGIFERLEVLLKVGLRGLAPVSNCHGVVLVIISRRACLEQVSTVLVNASQKEANTKRTLGRMACLDLGLAGNFSNNPLGRMLALVSVPVVETFISQKLGKETSICSHS